MLLKEQDLGFYNKSSNLIDFLESMETVNINTHCAATVPIIEQTVNGDRHYLLQLESLVEYAENNNIDDFETALHNVCEASSIDNRSITLTIQEHHAIENHDLIDLGSKLINEGYDIKMLSLPSTDPVSILGNLCLEAAEATDDYEYWIGNAFVSLNEGLLDKIRHKTIYKVKKNGDRKAYLVTTIHGEKGPKTRILNKADDEQYETSPGNYHTVLDLDTLKKVTNNDYDKMFDFIMRSKNAGAFDTVKREDGTTIKRNELWKEELANGMTKKKLLID